MKFSLCSTFIGLAIILSSIKCQAQTEHIKVYFNHPVDTSVATGPYAVNLHGATIDTLAAYINRAKYTVDVAQYDYLYASNTHNIANAIDSAYSRGVKIRWICDGSSPNSGLAYFDSGIYTLSSPVSANYGIMHHKFVIIDAHSPNAADPIVWTGSMDWNYEQISGDYNNTIIIQDSALAQAYTYQFNEMWGDTGLVPDTINSRFGPYKTGTTQHHFIIDGINIELYFSPTDGTDSYIVNAINSANTDLYFGVYTFTEPTAANAIKSKIQSGVYALGIMDQYSTLYGTADSILSAVMDSNLIIYAQNYSVYHSKYVIVDPCDFSSDPIVATGSHNWTYAANTLNDENELIIHDSTIANIYYQSFKKDFMTLGGTVSACKSLINTRVSDIDNGSDNIKIYPNPTFSTWQINTGGNWQGGWYELYDLSGKLILKSAINGPVSNIPASVEQGVYVVKVHLNNIHFVQKVIKL